VNNRRQKICESLTIILTENKFETEFESISEKNFQKGVDETFKDCAREINLLNKNCI